MKQLQIFLIVIAGMLLGKSVTSAEVVTNGKLQNATIFRTGAELVHTAKVQLASGTNDVVVEGLSSVIDQNSISINCSGGVTVLGSDFMKDYVTVKSQSDVIRKLKDSVAIYNTQIRKLEAQISTGKSMQEILVKQMSKERESINVVELSKLMDYYKTKSVEIETEMNGFNTELTNKRQRVALLNNQIAQEEGGKSKPVGKLSLKLASATAKSCDIKISYFTNFAYWSPLYDIHANGSDKQLKLTSKAKFSQSTGIDWEKTKIVLSTSVPSRGRIAPVLSAWFISPHRPAMTRGYMDESAEVMAQNSVSYKAAAPVMRVRGASSADAAKPLYVVDGMVVSEEELAAIDPSMIESVEVVKDASATSLYGAKASNGVVVVTTKSSFVTQEQNASADITYALDLPYDLVANGSEHTVNLRSFDVPATFEYYCVPKVDKTVFLLAGIKDWSKYDLMAGEATITNEGTYAGKTSIDPGSTKEVLHLTLGEDKRVVVNREKMQDFSSTKFFGNEKRQTYTYKLTVKNNKSIPVNVILKDQYPISTDKGITVELTDTSGAHNNAEVGTLTWEFELKPGEVREFRSGYMIKSPKDFNLY